MPGLFDSFTVRTTTLRNRIVVSPMCMYSSEDGFANDWHMVHLGSRAVGGASLVFTEATAVTPDGRISPADLGLWKDEQIEMLAHIFSFVAAQGAVPAMQLAHAGRKASTEVPWRGGAPVDLEHGGWSPIQGPSEIPFDANSQVPHELSITEIQAIVKAFADSAKRAIAAGAKILEIHGAHGYLLHSFLSPLSNHREDNYGGSLENRTRFVREVVEALRIVMPEAMPLFLRISATDWAEGGWDLEQSIELAKMVKGLGVDVIDCSSGALVPNVKIPAGPGYQVPFAERIRKEAGISTAAVGMIIEPMQADQIVRTGQADLVVLAREMLRNPYWPYHAGTVLRKEFEWPVQYGLVKPRK